MKPLVSVRLAANRDIHELAEIYSRVYADFDVGERWTKDKAYELLSYWYKLQPDLFFVAEFNGKLVGGFVAGIKPWWDGNHLVDGEIFVHTTSQRKGIGRLLTKTMFETAIRKYGAKVWDTYTFKKKYPIKWYKSLGFEEIEEWQMIHGDIRKALEKLG